MNLVSRPLPAGRTVTSVALVPGVSGTAPSLDEVRTILDLGTPLDPCAPTVRDWQYAPAASGSIVVAGATFQLQLFLGSRGRLTWPDGSAVMFDYPASP